MRVNEIFYSIQGEGVNVGEAMVFLRLAGCNLRCPFCDTDHSRFTEMSDDRIVEEINRYESYQVLITGGEPTLQLTVGLLTRLKAAGKLIQIETNGSIAIDPQALDLIDWITVSPKDAPVRIQRIDELKVVYQGQDMGIYDEYIDSGAMLSLQPLDTGDEARNKEIVQATIDYVLRNPSWRLSLQTHKMIGFK